ncbi:MAG: hypothetical protein H7A51_19085 [Akkermansiaceae bacterium]|nr:hypothetical protein [Akkermansiaceae bacterium]
MKVPLEPIPTEQIVLVEKESPRAEIRVRDCDDKGQGRPTSQLDKAYPWLLGISTCLSALLCWMYVTKPVITQSHGAGVDQQPPQTGVTASAAASVNDPTVKPDGHTDNRTESPQASLVPSDSSLPGEQPLSTKAEPTSAASPVAVNPGILAKSDAGKSASDVGLGWESTNLKVQHILSADSGDGELEKIVLNVPVLYETRTMRWTPQDIAQARNVMGRLMVYERNLNNLRKEGQAILKDWNRLLENTVPAPALRADSPSLPYNHGQGSQSGSLPDSSSVIKVEN